MTMIVHYKGSRIVLTTEHGVWLARGDGYVGHGLTANAALLDWKTAVAFLDSIFEHNADAKKRFPQ